MVFTEVQYFETSQCLIRVANYQVRVFLQKCSIHFLPAQSLQKMKTWIRNIGHCATVIIVVILT